MGVERGGHCPHVNGHCEISAWTHFIPASRTLDAFYSILIYMDGDVSCSVSVDVLSTDCCLREREYRICKTLSTSLHHPNMEQALRYMLPTIIYAPGISVFILHSYNTYMYTLLSGDLISVLIAIATTSFYKTTHR
jgi:hypothetical protein